MNVCGVIVEVYSCTVCPRTFVQFSKYTHYTTMDKTSWTYSTKYLLLAYIPRKRDVSKGNLG